MIGQTSNKIRLRKGVLVWRVSPPSCSHWECGFLREKQAYSKFIRQKKHKSHLRIGQNVLANIRRFPAFITLHSTYSMKIIQEYYPRSVCLSHHNLYPHTLQSGELYTQKYQTYFLSSIWSIIGSVHVNSRPGFALEYFNCIVFVLVLYRLPSIRCDEMCRDKLVWRFFLWEIHFWHWIELHQWKANSHVEWICLINQRRSMVYGMDSG